LWKLWIHGCQSSPRAGIVLAYLSVTVSETFVRLKYPACHQKLCH